MDGEDGWELIEAFGEEFRVDLAEFDPSTYFGPEASAFPPLFMIQVFRLFVLREDAHNVGGVVPITIGDLVAAAESRRWGRKKVSGSILI